MQNLFIYLQNYILPAGNRAPSLLLHPPQPSLFITAGLPTLGASCPQNSQECKGRPGQYLLPHSYCAPCLCCCCGLHCCCCCCHRHWLLLMASATAATTTIVTSGASSQHAAGLPSIRHGLKQACFASITAALSRGPPCLLQRACVSPSPLNSPPPCKLVPCLSKASMAIALHTVLKPKYFCCLHIEMKPLPGNCFIQ